MYTKPATEWITPQQVSLAPLRTSCKQNGENIEMNRSASPALKNASQLSYHLDSIPQRLSPTGSVGMYSSNKPIYIGSTGDLSVPGSYVSIPRATDMDDGGGWGRVSVPKDCNELYNHSTERVKDVQIGSTSSRETTPPCYVNYGSADRARDLMIHKDLDAEQQRMDYQYRINKLQAQLEDMQQKRNYEVERLQSQLGASEYEVEKIKRMQKEQTEEHRKEFADLKCHMKQKADCTKRLEGLLAASKEELITIKRSRDSLQNYLRDVPTVDELNESTEVIRKLETENEKLKSQLQLTEKKLQKSKELLQEKIDEIHLMEVTKEEVEHKVDRLNSSLTRYRERDAQGPIDLQEYEECQWENEVLKSERDRLKQMVESKHKKLKALHHQNQKSEKKLQEQISREEDTINAMREQGNTKDAKLEELRHSVREMSLQNQSLMEENLHLQDSIQKFERIFSKESKAMHVKVDRELAECAADFQSLVSLCEARSAGERPDITSIFGLNGRRTDTSNSNNNNNDNCDPFNYESAKLKQRHVKELLACAETLRTLISEQYAEEMGNNCVTQ